MRILKTIKKFGVLNRIFVIDKKNKENGLNYLYTILPKNFKAPIMTTEDGKNIVYINSNKKQLNFIVENMTTIVFENEETGIKGVTESDLLEIVKDRIYNRSIEDYKYNREALKHIEEALMWLNRVTEENIERKLINKKKFDRMF